MEELDSDSCCLKLKREREKYTQVVVAYFSVILKTDVAVPSQNLQTYQYYTPKRLIGRRYKRGRLFAFV